MLKAILRTDASPTMGGGHVVRCMALAEGLADEGWRCEFAVTHETLSTVPWLAACEFLVHELSSGDEAGELARLAPQGADLFVIDHGKSAADYERSFRGWARRILVMNDISLEGHECDLLLCQNMNMELGQKVIKESNQCRVLVGPEFALLRKEFTVHRSKALSQRKAGSVNRIFVSLGMTDAYNINAVILDGLASLQENCIIDVVIGKKAAHLEDILVQAASHPSVVNVHTDLSAAQVAELMILADLAIGAPGMSSWERCSLGLPSLLIVWADNQKNNAIGLVEAGAAVSIGNWPDVKPSNVTERVQRLIDSPDAYRKMSIAAASLCDGMSLQRTIEEIKACLQEAREADVGT